MAPEYTARTGDQRMRQLVSRRTVSDITPHPNADNIEIAVVDGWKVIVKKGDLQAGDACVYFEIDSVLPCVPEFEFLRKSCHVKRDWLPEGEGYRLRTIKLRGQVSQGLVVKALEDATIWERVVKYDPPIPAKLAGVARGNWPEFLRKTDQERCQNLVREISESYERGDEYELSVKLDGSSCSYALKDGEFYVCSRNISLKTDQEGNSFVDMAPKLDIESKLRVLGRNLQIQGELMGPGIQGNREGFGEHEFFVFDIFDIDARQYVGAYERLTIIAEMNLTHVPLLPFDYLPSPDIEDLVCFSEGPSVNHPIREGVVFKRLDGQFSFKAISNAFLLAEK